MFLPKVRVSMMASGKNHGLLLDSHGFVWAWGEADKGQTGLGHAGSCLVLGHGSRFDRAAVTVARIDR